MQGIHSFFWKFPSVPPGRPSAPQLHSYLVLVPCSVAALLTDPRNCTSQRETRLIQAVFQASAGEERAIQPRAPRAGVGRGTE